MTIASVWSWFAADDSGGTVLANIVTIIGLLGALRFLSKISASISLSGSLSVRLIHAQLQPHEPGQALNDSWPPGDRSRILYSVYSVSRQWDEPYWAGNLPINKLNAAQRRSYNAHLTESITLLDGVLRHAPSDARDKWLLEITPHVLAHYRVLKSWSWRFRSMFMTVEMRALIQKCEAYG